MSLILKNASNEYYFDSEGCYITELSNTEADAQLSIAQARITPGVTTAWHKLVETTERYCIVSGTGLVEVGECPATQVTSGDVVIISPMERQRITNIGEDDLVFLAICTPRFKPENYQDAQ
jgi:mannose-6-phosphate isomerase-like protein (cupin superfamily)